MWDLKLPCYYIKIVLNYWGIGGRNTPCETTYVFGYDSEKGLQMKSLETNMFPHRS